MAPKMFESRVPTKDYYQTLGIEPAADIGTIRHARNALALKYHPDKNPGNAEALAKFKEIQEAFEVLSNAAERDSYDSLHPSGQDEGGLDKTYNDIDQQIWNTWHGIFDGMKGSSYSQLTQRPATKDQPCSTTAEGDANAQQGRKERSFVTPKANKIAFPRTPKKPGYEGVYVYDSSDDDDARENDEPFEDPFVDFEAAVDAESHEPHDHSVDVQDGGNEQAVQQSIEQGNEQALQKAIGEAIEQESDEDEGEWGKDTSMYTKPNPAEWFFEDYFYPDLTEKDYLPDFRRTAKKTRGRWRNSCRNAEYAKMNTKYYNSAAQKAMMEEQYERTCGVRDQWYKVLRIQEANLKEHEKIAKKHLRARTAQLKKDVATLRKARVATGPPTPRCSTRGSRATSTGGRSSRFKKRSAFWDDSEESESEWTPRSAWKP